MAHLLNVPLEVLLQITSHLTTREYGYLRRSCKQIEALLFGAFAREFFSKRQFALIGFSIQALIDIAKSRLGPSLTHLIIHLEHPSDNVRHISPASQFSVEHNRYHTEFLNHWEFVSTGLDVDMLSDALRHLPNLETIGMRDFHSTSRHRDGIAWNSYGCPTFIAETRSQLVLFATRDRGSGYTSHVFLVILRAIGNSAVSGRNPKLTRMEVLLHTCGLPDQSFKIPDRFDARISTALSKLTTIFLDHLTEEHPWFWVRSACNNTEPVMGIGYFLSRFLVKATSLEHLRLNFQSYQPRSIASMLLWLADARQGFTGPMPKSEDLPIPGSASATVKDLDSLPEHFPQAPEFPKLKTIEIGMATVDEWVLHTLYQKYKSTLQGIGLHKTTLTCATNRKKANLLARLCNKMAQSDLQLRAVQFSYIQQTLIGRSLHRGEILFKESRNKSVKVWKGSAFSQSVKDITDEIEFRCNLWVTMMPR
ncbi:hypothetical protein F5Y12DRAFT_786795 [Xylaria sp. FL1777]|nr:hypothetical protein F5Y12DRAFT_786795 [Xylaria sp. FL1777]